MSALNCIYCHMLLLYESRKQTPRERDREIDADQIQTCIPVIAYSTHCATALTYNKILMYMACVGKVTGTPDQVFYGSSL